MDNLDQAKQSANYIFKQVCFHINRNVKKLDSQTIQSALSTISLGSEFETKEITKEALAEMERKVIEDFPRFMNLDLASIIGSFLKLHYVPRIILAELNQL
jgi:hypothetical protein